MRSFLHFRVLIGFFCASLYFCSFSIGQTESQSSDSIEAIKQKCRNGDSGSMVTLGKIYLEQESSRGMAIQCFEKAAKLGNADAMLELYKNNRRSARWLENAAELGNPKAIVILCRRLVIENNVSGLRSPKARDWCEKGIAAGESECIELLGRCFEKGIGGPQDPSKAIAHFQQASEKGVATSDSKLGWCYLRGEMIEKNQQRGFEYLRRGEKGNDKYSIRLLGLAILSDVLHPNNIRLQTPFDPFDVLKEIAPEFQSDRAAFCKRYELMAKELLSKAAAQKDALSLCLLAEFHSQDVRSELRSSLFRTHDARGGDSNPALAFSYAEQSAKLGNSVGMSLLSDYYRMGYGVKANSGKCFSWMRQAEENGLEDAKYWLGLYYAHGFGTRPNFSACVKMMQESQQLGNENAHNFLLELERRMEEARLARLEQIEHQQRMLSDLGQWASDVANENARREAENERRQDERREERDRSRAYFGN